MAWPQLDPFFKPNWFGLLHKNLLYRGPTLLVAFWKVIGTVKASYSGVTKIGVTRGGKWWYHLILSSKSDGFFIRRPLKRWLFFFLASHHSHPLRLPTLLPVFFVNSAHKIWFHSGVNPLDDVTRGDSIPQWHHWRATPELVVDHFSLTRPNPKLLT